MSTDKRNKRLWVLPVMLLAMASLLLAIWAGWIRSGWDFSKIGIAGHHGALMVGSFLGTLIAAERAVTLKRIWLLVPLVNGMSLPLFLAGYPNLSIMCLIAGGLGMSMIYLKILSRHTEWYIYLLLGGALMYLAGSILLFKTGFYAVVFPWWMAFFLLTIVGERIELSRYLPINDFKKMILVGLLVLFVLGSLLPYHTWGRYVMATSLAGNGLWLMRFDMARKAAKRPGIHRYTGLGLLIGYGWLVMTAGLMLYATLGMMYDAVLHAFFIGFVMAMIFAHAPIILPGILKFNFQPFHSVLWIWVALLHSSIVIRIVADLLNSPLIRQWGSLLNGIVIVGFFLTMAFLTLKNIRAKPRSQEVRTTDNVSI